MAETHVDGIAVGAQVRVVVDDAVASRKDKVGVVTEITGAGPDLAFECVYVRFEDEPGRTVPFARAELRVEEAVKA